MPLRRYRKPTTKRRPNLKTKTKYGKRKTTGRRAAMRPMISRGPFPKIMSTTLLYKSPSTNTITSSGLTFLNWVNFRVNSLFDFDFNDVFSNKQPLFFDQLCSDTGPYRNYRVNAWKTTLEVINLTDAALHVYYDPMASTQDQADTIAEVRNRRGVITKMLTAQNNAKPTCVFSKYNSVKQFAPNKTTSDTNYQAAYNNNPASTIFSTLAWERVDQTVTSFTIAVKVSHVFYCSLYNADSISS